MKEILNTIDQLPIVVGMRDTTWLLTTLELTHLLGIIVLVGASLIFDLRLLGYYRRISTYQAYCFLLPIAQKGMGLILPSGLLLWVANATNLSANPLFWIKIGLLVVASTNLWIFHRLVVPSSFGRQGVEELPRGSEVSALISICCWIAIVICGKLL